MYLYSVHDTTLISLFSVFDVKLDKWPPFAGYISLELYENQVSNENLPLQCPKFRNSTRTSSCFGPMIPRFKSSLIIAVVLVKVIIIVDIFLYF